MNALETVPVRAGIKPVWIVDDDRSIRWVLEKALAREAIPYKTFASVYEALQALGHAQPQVIVSDIRMPGESGLVLLNKVKERYPHIPVIVMTAYSDLDSAVAAFQGGAFEYLPKPFDVDHALALIRRATAEQDTPAATQQPSSVPETPEILGQAPAMQEVFRAIGRLSQSNVTVLITGESGTGKELVARALHRHSPRAAGPFVAINTAAIPKDLLESELFGHERGSFTGAQGTRRGRFEQAEGGTLFLDEIGDMPLPLQVKLLRVLQEMQVRPVGAAQSFSVDVRVISATHRTIETEMTEGRFREDLYYRLNVVALRLPPLSERREDIPLLANYFLATLTKKYNKTINGIVAEALEMLISAAWPGNVRQLYNVIEQAVALCNAPLVPLALVQQAIKYQQTEFASFEQARKQFEREYLTRLLKMTGGNVSQAARLAQRNRTEFYKLLQRHALDPALFKALK